MFAQAQPLQTFTKQHSLRMQHGAHSELTVCILPNLHLTAEWLDRTLSNSAPHFVQSPKREELAMASRQRFFRRIRIIVGFSVLLICLAPPGIFTLRQFAYLSSTLASEAAILTNISERLWADSPPINLESKLAMLRTLATDISAAGTHVHAALESKQLVVLPGDLRQPVVSAESVVTAAGLEPVRFVVSRSLRDRIPVMIAVLTFGLALALSLLALLNRLVFRPWLLADATREALFERFEDISTLSNDWFWEWDADFCFLLNTMKPATHGSTLPLDRACPWDIEDVTPSEPWEITLEDLWQQKPFTLRYSFPGEGGMHWHEIHGKPLFGPAGEFQGYRGAGVDITEDERLKTEIARHSDDLHRLVDEQSMALLAARREADTANKAKSIFLANMSHEIRTPMNSIMGLTHLLGSNELSPKQRSQVDNIRLSGEHLLHVINDILDFSKIEAGKMRLDDEVFDLEKMLDDVALLMQDRFLSKQLELVFDLDCSAGKTFIGDPQRLSQALLNYISNAVKFTRQGHVLVRVSCKDAGIDYQTLQFSVTDTGIGLTEEQASRLFAPFEQAQRSTNRQYGGSGLGLSIVKNLAEMMGGEVGVSSRYGHGSTFWFSARLKCAQAQDAEEMPPKSLYGKRALVVDDNETASKVLSAMLTQCNLNVDSCHSGAEAVAAITSQASLGKPYELVFTDWNMPEMSGTELSRQIAAMTVPTHPAVICVTAYGREEVLEHSDAEDFVNILSKPVSPSRLRTLLASLQKSTLPVAASPRTENEQLKSASELAGKRLLLVEDDELNRKVAEAVLTRLGLDVVTANSGEEALAIVHSSNIRFDCVLMDIDLPGMDGIACSGALHSLPGQTELTIIALTAMASAHDRERCLQSGMVDFIGKPFDLLRLKQTLLQWMATEPLYPAPQETAPRTATPHPQTESIAQENGARGMINELASLLAAGDPAALDCLAHQEASLQKLLGRTYRALRQAVNSYDFATAQAFITPHLATDTATSKPEGTQGAKA